jgi:hypothetical protein
MHGIHPAFTSCDGQSDVLMQSHAYSWCLNTELSRSNAKTLAKPWLNPDQGLVVFISRVYYARKCSTYPFDPRRGFRGTLSMTYIPLVSQSINPDGAVGRFSFVGRFSRVQSSVGRFSARDRAAPVGGDEETELLSGRRGTERLGRRTTTTDDGRRADGA